MEGTEPLIGPSEHFPRGVRLTGGCLGLQSHWSNFLDHRVWVGVGRAVVPSLILRFRTQVERRTLAEYRTRIGPSHLDDLEPRLSTVLCSELVDIRACAAIERAVWHLVSIPVRVPLWRRVEEERNRG